MTVQKDVCRPKVVVVDDEVDFLKMMERWLKPKYDVTYLSGGQDTCEDIAALDPDIVIMDIHMPGRGGFQICRELRKQAGFEDLPVIFLTGSKSDRDFVQYLEFGGCRYMVKPITGKELKDAVAEQLGFEIAR